MKHFVEHDFVHGVWHVDKGVLYTLKELFVRPGHSVREFIQGKRAKFFSFVTLIIILIAISSLISPFIKIRVADLLPIAAKETMNSFEQFSTKYPKVVVLILIPLYSLFSYLWFRKAKLNYSEHLVLNSYKTCVDLLLGLVFALITVFYTNIPNLLIIYYVLVVLGGVVYSVWFYSQFFMGYSYSRKSAIIRAIMIPVSYLFISGAVGFIMGVSKMMSEPTVAQTHLKSEQKVYTNPLKVQFGDPFVLFSDGTYYMYGTGGGADKGFSAYSSKDLVNWKPEGQVYFHDNKNGWSDPKTEWGGAYWAPEVYKVKGKFYLFYSAQWKVNPAKEVENFKIGVAVSDKPTGPFVDLATKPLFDPGYPVIDANVFFDTDGKCYLYYSRAAYKHPIESEIADQARKSGKYKEVEESWVYGVELKPDFSGVTGEPVVVLRPPVKLNDKQSAWESLSVTSGEVNRRWTEGSVTFKKDGIYYIMYSANHFGGEHYAVGYATSSSPLGPFKKAENNPVLQKNTDKGGIVSGTGHNSIIYSPDGKEMFCVYHGRTSATGSERVVFIDRMKVENGKITVYGPTTQPQKMPAVKQ